MLAPVIAFHETVLKTPVFEFSCAPVPLAASEGKDSSGGVFVMAVTT
jgi:hypothetical protein